uniref:Secreted protein n=1 Tax=Rhizophagus irregularis (strain DAOM 181602 / DAOM 197198 / MUCL 43194) TaxID=747089 RepID=U9U608_RHIID
MVVVVVAILFPSPVAQQPNVQVPYRQILVSPGLHRKIEERSEQPVLYKSAFETTDGIICNACAAAGIIVAVSKGSRNEKDQEVQEKKVNNESAELHIQKPRKCIVTLDNIQRF